MMLFDYYSKRKYLQKKFVIELHGDSVLKVILHTLNYIAKKYIYRVFVLIVMVVLISLFI